MKVLWISASFSAAAKQSLLGTKNAYGSGNWIDDEATHLITEEGVEGLTLVSSCSNKMGSATNNGITYVDLGLGPLTKSSRSLMGKPRKAILETIGRVSPDIIQVWGTENPLSQIAMQCAKESGKPSILCPQGLVASLLHFPNGHMAAREMCGANVLDWLKMPLFNTTKKAYQKYAPFEKKAIELADFVLSDNQWTFDYCRCINPTICPLWYPLPVNDCFVGASWSVSECIPRTIMSVSPRSSYKGQHVLLRAVGRIKEWYPDVKVYFPAMAGKMSLGVANALKRTPYSSMLLRLIHQYGLQDNVVFLERLSPSKLADAMRTCNVFVNPSVIESNCMSLREAMWMGMPVVSAFTGSIQEYVDNGRNGILYRYEEDEILACELERLFENQEKCERLGSNARKSMAAFYSNGATLIDLYKSVLANTAN